MMPLLNISQEKEDASTLAPGGLFAKRRKKLAVKGIQSWVNGGLDHMERPEYLPNMTGATGKLSPLPAFFFF